MRIAKRIMLPILLFSSCLAIFSLRSLFAESEGQQSAGIEIYFDGEKFNSLEQYRQHRRQKETKGALDSSFINPSEFGFKKIDQIIKELTSHLPTSGWFYLNNDDIHRILRDFYHGTSAYSLKEGGAKGSNEAPKILDHFSQDKKSTSHSPQGNTSGESSTKDKKEIPSGNSSSAAYLKSMRDVKEILHQKSPPSP